MGQEATLISVDLETGGTLLGASPIIAVGACLVSPRWEAEWDSLATLLAEAKATPGVFVREGLFYTELQLHAGAYWDDFAEGIHGLSRERLAAFGLPPVEGLKAFVDWVHQQAGPEARYRLVSHNAAFDWAHLQAWFVRYALPDPFDPFPACTKNIARGRFRAEGEAYSGQTALGPLLGLPPHLGKHNALADALSQSLLYQKLMAP